jgi:zinc protease
MIDRSVPPKITDEIKLRLPELQSFTLDNGLTVHFSEKNSLPIVKLNFVLKTGSTADPEGKSGLANLTGMVIDEGAHGYDALEIDTMLESLGSIFSISVDHDFIVFSLLSLKKNFEKSLEIISWILREPNFQESDFSREKEKLLSEIIRLKDEPSFIADWVFGFYLFKNSPYKYPNIGTSKFIKEIEIADVRDFYEKNFSPQNFTIAAVGNLHKDEFAELLVKYFGEWETDSQNRRSVFSLNHLKKQLILVDKKEAAQSEIRIGNFASQRKAPDYFAKKIVNSVLGGQFSSRLNHNLREEKGITYGVRTNFLHSVSHGFFEASTAVDTINTKIALREFYKEFDLIRKDITDEEIAFAKSYLKKTFPSQFEDYSKIVSNITTQIIFNLEKDFYKNVLQNISAVTKEEAVEAARKNILPSEQLTVVVGDAAILEKELAELTRDSGDNNFMKISAEELEL